MLRLQDAGGGAGEKTSFWATLTALQKKIVLGALVTVGGAAVVVGAVLGTRGSELQTRQINPPLEVSACSAAPCAVDYQCRSPIGICGEGSSYCNEFSTWTLMGCCPSGSASANNGGGGRRQLQITIVTCTGDPCPSQNQCRSKFDFCGVGEAWCNAESTWTPACSSRDGTPAPVTIRTSSPTGSATRGPTVQISCPTSAPTKSPTQLITLAPTLSGTTAAPSTLAPTMSGATDAPSTAAIVPAPSPTASKQVGSYFAEWSIYGRGFTIKTLHSSGQAAKLTFLNYAFANIFNKNGQYVCDASITKAEQGAGDGGDQFAAYGKGFAASDSVDGTGDIWDFPTGDPRLNANPKVAPLKGNFNQIRKLKAMYPNLKVLISIGGWSWSKWFSAAAATSALRQALVLSCVNQYIKGNLPYDSGSNAGGTGSGEGVFDGIDIDWEYPGVQGIGYNTIDSDNDSANQVELFKEFRKQLDAYGATVNRKLYLTTAIGAAVKHISKTEPADYAKYCDWVNIMTYDYNGAWASSGPTDFQSNLFPDSNSPNFQSQPDYNTDTSAGILAGLGIPKTKLNIGIPFYGRGWTGVTAGANAQYPGLYRAATGAAPGTYEAGIEDYKVLKNAAGTVYTHATTQQSYKYDPASTRFWSYDTPQDVQRKVSYVKTQGLGGVFAWSADGDAASELTTEMSKVNS